ncbi:MAG: methylornithine synthase PylB [bacterium]|nr:methylornithine synthase PylB [bacterium]
MTAAPSHQRLSSILDKAYQNEPLTREDIVFILQLRQKDHIDALFKTAGDLRRIYFRDNVFLYGFLYISTYCRNNCNFCFYRVSNPRAPRYRKEAFQVEEAAVSLARSGVHLIDLTMGEDSQFFTPKAPGFESLIKIINTVKEVTRLPVMISPGVVPEPVLEACAKAGADWYACYQETHRPTLFEQLRPGQSYQDRFNSKITARKYGLLTEEGILVGAGETDEDIAHTIETVRTLDAHQVRAMNFVPQKGTPMENHPPPDPLRELLITALFRLVFPGKLIPATLDVEGLDGLERRLHAGANVVTSIVPPLQGLAGVAQSALDIDDARRTVTSVLPVLEKCGLRAAEPGEYTAWLKNHRTGIEGRS